MATTRVSEEEVKKILDISLTDEQITPYLRVASTHVTDTCVTVASGYNSDKLEALEMFLAAHFAKCARDPELSQKKVGEASKGWAGRMDLGLDLTSFGQQVQVLDHKGFLTAASRARRPANMQVLG